MCFALYKCVIFAASVKYWFSGSYAHGFWLSEIEQLWRWGIDAATYWAQTCRWTQTLLWMPNPDDFLWVSLADPDVSVFRQARSLRTRRRSWSARKRSSRSCWRRGCWTFRGWRSWLARRPLGDGGWHRRRVLTLTDRICTVSYQFVRQLHFFCFKLQYLFHIN